MASSQTSSHFLAVALPNMVIVIRAFPRFITTSGQMGNKISLPGVVGGWSVFVS